MSSEGAADSGRLARERVALALAGHGRRWSRWAARPRKYACVVRLEKIFRNPIIEAVEKGELARRECTFDFHDDGGCRITHAR